MSEKIYYPDDMIEIPPIDGRPFRQCLVKDLTPKSKISFMRNIRSEGIKARYATKRDMERRAARLAKENQTIKEKIKAAKDAAAQVIQNTSEERKKLINSLILEFKNIFEDPKDSKSPMSLDEIESQLTEMKLIFAEFFAQMELKLFHTKNAKKNKVEEPTACPGGRYPTGGDYKGDWKNVVDKVLKTKTNPMIKYGTEGEVTDKSINELLNKLEAESFDKISPEEELKLYEGLSKLYSDSKSDTKFNSNSFRPATFPKQK